MNIADKQKLYSEMFRVLKPMGTLVIYDIFKGPKKEYNYSSFNYPVPWASDSSMSFLIAPDDARKLLKDTGFRELIWEDKTASALEWFNQIIKPFRNYRASSTNRNTYYCWTTMANNGKEFNK